MRILTIIGTPHKGNTRAITDLFLKEFEDTNNLFDEIVLPNDFQEFCYGCANCILNGEEKCPHFHLVNPIIERIEKADFNYNCYACICYVLFEWIEGIVRPPCVYMVST